jgi:hypothetical protein
MGSASGGTLARWWVRRSSGLGALVVTEASGPRRDGGTMPELELGIADKHGMAELRQDGEGEEGGRRGR